MGAQTTDHKRPNYDPYAFEDEEPVRTITLAPFYIGRYPVTVCEYERFVKKGGYKKDDWDTQFSEPTLSGSAREAI